LHRPTDICLASPHRYRNRSSSFTLKATTSQFHFPSRNDVCTDHGSLIGDENGHRSQCPLGPSEPRWLIVGVWWKHDYHPANQLSNSSDFSTGHRACWANQLLRRGLRVWNEAFDHLPALQLALDCRDPAWFMQGLFTYRFDHHNNLDL